MQGYYETISLSLGSAMTTEFFIKSPPPTHSSTNANFQPTVHENDDNVLQKKIDATEESSASEQQMPIASEGDNPENEILEGNSEIQTQPVLCVTEDSSDSKHVCTTQTTSDLPTLEVDIPTGDNEVVETTVVLSANTGDNSVIDESQVLSDNSHTGVLEMSSMLGNSEDKETPSELPAVKDTHLLDDFAEENPPQRSPVSPPLDALASVTYETPEDGEDNPDGFASLFHFQKESVKGKEIQMQDLADSDDQCFVTVISRRSRHRAGILL